MQNFVFTTLLEEIKYIRPIISEENRLIVRLNSKCTTEPAWSSMPASIILRNSILNLESLLSSPDKLVMLHFLALVDDS